MSPGPEKLGIKTTLFGLPDKESTLESREYTSTPGEAASSQRVMYEKKKRGQPDLLPPID